MGDRAQCHIVIGGRLPRILLSELLEHVSDYDLRDDWEGEPFTIADHDPGTSLDLYGTQLNGGSVPALETFCRQHGLAYRRWSGACPGAFDSELVTSFGDGTTHSTNASDSEDPVFSAEDIERAESLEALRETLRTFERQPPSFELLG